MVVKVKIPENVNIAELLQAANIKPKPYLLDKIAFFCYEIHLAAVYHRDYLNNKKRPFFPLYSKILQKYIKDYLYIEEILINNGVIEKDEKYKIGEKSYGFRFTEKYYGVKYKQYEIQTIGLHNKIANYYKNDPLPVTKITKPYIFLKKFWTNGKLKMDTEGAMNWINATYQTQLNCLDYYFSNEIKNKNITEKKAGKQKDIIIKELNEKIETWKTSVDNFNVTNPVFTVDDFSKRLHTKFTNLKKELRNFVTYDGHQLVSLDIKNSQPYLSLVLLNQDFWRERGKPDKKILLYRKIGVDKIKKEIIETISYTIKLAHSSESVAGKGFEFYHFCSLVTSGLLYEYLMNLFQEIRTNPFSRDEVKRLFLIYLYYNPDVLDKLEEGYASNNLLNEVFPNISEMFKLLKQKGSYKYEPDLHKAIYQPIYQFPFHILNIKECFKFPPQLLQRIESYLVIEVVCKQLKKGNNNMPLFTIHDSIVTTKQYEQIVNDKLILELKNAIGYEPTIKPEYFAPLQPIIKTEFTYKDIIELHSELF